MGDKTSATETVPDEIDINEIIAMAWDDETSFDAITRATGLAEADIIKLMRRHMKPSSFRMWRKRVSGRKAKHDARLRR
ncbi:MAG: TIGR03643 family protein [Pseudomonadota bacterium]